MNHQDLERGLRKRPELPANLLDKLTAAATGELGAVAPPAPEWRRAVRFAAALAAVSGIGIAVLGTAGWHALPMAAAGLFAGWFALGAGAAAWLLARLMIPGAPAGRLPALLPVSAAASFALLSLALFEHSTYPRMLAIAGACLVIGSVHAALVQLIASRLLRAGCVTNARGAALAGGLLGAVSGVLVLTVFCAHHDLWHVVLGHLSVLVVVPLAGWLWTRSPHL